MKGVTAYPDGTLGHTGAEPFLCTVMSCLADLATVNIFIVFVELAVDLFFSSDFASDCRGCGAAV